MFYDSLTYLTYSFAPLGPRPFAASAFLIFIFSQASSFALRPPPSSQKEKPRPPLTFFQRISRHCDNLHINADIFSEGKAVYKRSYPPTGI